MSTSARAAWAVGLPLALALLIVAGILLRRPDGDGAPRQALDGEPAEAGETDRGEPPPAPAESVEQPDCHAPAARRGAVHAATKPPQPASVARRFLAQHGDHDVGLHRPIVADLADVSPFEADDPSWLAIARARAPRVDRLLPPRWPPSLDYARQRALEAALAAPALDEFIAAARMDPAVLRQGWDPLGAAGFVAMLNGAVDGLVGVEPEARRRRDSVLAHALRARPELLRRVGEIPAAAFGLAELAAAIELGIDAADFVALLGASGADAAATWQHRTLTRRYNLADLAAVHARPRILRALLARGVPLAAGPPAALDELALALAATQPAPEALAAVVGQLADLGERPFLPSTAARIATLAPGISIPDLHPDAQAALALPQIHASARRLTALTRRMEMEAAQAQRIADRCRPVWLAKAAAGGGELTSKVAQHQAMRKREQHSRRAQLDQARSVAAGLGVEFLEVADAFLDAALQEGPWQDLLPNLDALVDVAPAELAAQVPAGLLRVALDASVPMPAVLELLDRNGGAMPPDIIMTLIQSSRRDAARAAADLEAWGLQPGFVDADGRGAVDHVVDAFRSGAGSRLAPTLAWLEYLAGRGVSFQLGGRGLDPLDTALFAVLDDPASAPVAEGVVQLAQVLVDNGASVRASHREIAAHIQAAAPDAYASLAQAIPDLAISPERVNAAE